MPASTPSHLSRQGTAWACLLPTLCGLMPAGVASAQPLSPPKSPDRERYDGQMLIRVTIRTMKDLMLVNQVSDDCWSHSPGPGAAGSLGTLDYRVDAAGLASLRRAGISCEIIDADVQASVDAESARLADALSLPWANNPLPPGGNQGRGWFDDFKTAQQVSDYANDLIALRPDLASRELIGHSIEGRDIYAIRLNGKAAPPGVVKPTILINSLQHAREWITVMTTMYITDQLINGYGSDTRATNLLDRYQLLIIPIVNADGYEYTWTKARFWRKNRHKNNATSFGVDLNRNWSFAWGSDNGSSGNPSSDTYRGTAPFSEPEVAALRDYTFANPGIVLHLDVHSYGPQLLYSWGYTSDPAPAVGALSRLGFGMRQAILDSGGVPYTTGQCYQTLYPVSGGSIDWFYGDQGILSWTPELRGPSFNPPPTTILPCAREIYAAVLYLAETYCQGDIDFNGFVDTDDFDAFIRAFEAGADAADFDHSGFIDSDDFDAFIIAFDKGC